MRDIRFLTPLLLGAALLAAPARAQTPADLQERAAILHSYALRLEESLARTEQYREAARLHLQSARLRPEHDPQGSDCLMAAAHLLFDLEPLTASRLLREAGEKALARGDVLTAATAFTEVAWVSHEAIRRGRGDPAEWVAIGKRYQQRAALLTTSPFLLASDRDDLLNRVGH